MGFRSYESALRGKLKNWIEKIGEADLLVGIPCFNSEDTIRFVVEQAAKGLKKHYPDMKTGVIVSDGGSTDDSRENAESADIPEGIDVIVDIYRGLPGKGTSLRAVFEAGALLNAKAIVVVDSDLRSITPDWIKFLADPVLRGEVDFVAPLYKRHKYDGTITNMVVYPTTRALYGKRVRQPIGGDFAFSGELSRIYTSKDVWMTDVARFGIDIWMTTVAINEKRRIAQVNLGAKIHDAKDPASDLVYMFRQVIATMFYMMGEYEAEWMAIEGSEDIPVYDGVEPPRELPNIAVNLKKLQVEFVDGFEQFSPLYKQFLDMDNYKELEKVYENVKKGKGVVLNAELWSKIVYDFAYTFHNWSRNRRKLIDIMAPLYFGRTYSYVVQTRTMNWEEAEEVVIKQAEIFEKNKSYIRDKICMWNEMNI